MVAPIPDSDYRIKLQVFEGPLDLLLFLIRKNELDIYDIPIGQVTKQYLETLYAMGELKLELAGEFFVMAATLMEIKSRMLLPKNQQAVAAESEDEEELDPRWELVHQLIQYKKFKDAATGIADMITTRQAMLERAQVQQNLAAAERPLRPSDRIELWNAFNQVLRRLADRHVSGDIQDDNLTVVDQMEMILKRIAFEPRFTFSSLLPGKTSLRNLVATFIAVLELTRMNKIRISQEQHFDDIFIDRRDPEPLPSPEAAQEEGLLPLAEGTAADELEAAASQATATIAQTATPTEVEPSAPAAAELADVPAPEPPPETLPPEHDPLANPPTPGSLPA